MTKRGITPRQRDILLIPIPFTDLQTTKRRPVLVLSNDTYNRTSEDILVAAMTSNLQSKFFGITVDPRDVEVGVLKRTSLIRADKLYTLSKRIILKKFGRLTAERYGAVVEVIKKLIEWFNPSQHRTAKRYDNLREILGRPRENG